MKNNDIIEIKDRFLVDDSHSNIRGFVSAYDENGNRLFLRENMIVISGRKKILERLRSTQADSNFFSKMSAFLDTNTDVTNPTMTVESLGGLNKINRFKDAMKFENEKTLVNIETENSIDSFSKIFEGGETYYIAVIDEDTNERIFSPITELVELKTGRFYTLSLVGASDSIAMTDTYCKLEGGKYKITNSPAAGTSNLYLATPAKILYDKSKEYYILSGNSFVKKPSEGGLRTDTDYYIRNIKGDIDFELVECFKIKYDASKLNLNGQTRFGSLGLYFTDGSVLFSRVTFPPYSARQNLTFFYYLYF